MKGTHAQSNFPGQLKASKTHRDGAAHVLCSVRIHLHLHPLQKHISVSGSLLNATSRSLAEIQPRTGGLAELPEVDHITHAANYKMYINPFIQMESKGLFSGGEPHCSVYC